MSYITLNKNFFYENLNHVVKALGNKKKICLVIKDNAYGHGINEISSLAKEYGIDNVYVKSDDEAELVAKYNFNSIIILNSIKKHSKKNVSCVINSLDDLKFSQKNSNIELEINTGLNRNGICFEQINDALKIIEKRNLIISGVFTHFRSSDEDDKFIYNQEKNFNKYVKLIKNKIHYNFRTHCGNSHSLFKTNHKNYDLFRVGIYAYGYSTFSDIDLKPILSLYANKISTRILNKNETIGYGSKSYIVKKNNFIVSTYDIGYGDGFFRIDENKKFKIKNGKYILGRISMDCMSVEGDDEEIILFDNVKKLALVHNTITYEVLTSLKNYIKRTII